MMNTVTDALRQHIFSRLTFFHLSALLLLSASALANFRYGLELGSTELEKAIAASASLGADIFNALGLLLVAWAWRNRKWVKAVASAFAVICTMTYSMNAGIGFAASTKDALIAERTHLANAESDRVGGMKRIQAQLDALAPARSASEVSAEMAGILADPRAGDCSKIDGKYTRANCPRYFELKAELARSNERTRLTRLLEQTSAERVTTATNDSNKPFVMSVDPGGESTAVYLSKFGIHLMPSDIRPWQTLLFVVLVVICGPIALWCAEEYIEAHRKPVRPASRPESVDHSPPPDSPPTVKLEGDKPRQKPQEQPVSIAKLPKSAGHTLHKIQKAGGRIEAPSQNKLAEVLKLSRTSMRRAVDELRRSGHIVVRDDHGYALEMIR